MPQRLIKLLLKIFLLLSALGLLGAAVAPFINPQTWLMPAFLGLNYPILLAGYLVLLSIYLVAGSKKSRFLFILPPLLTIHLFLNHFGINYFANDVVPVNNAITFMTYNVHTFSHATDFDVDVHQEILNLIRDQQPDVLVMQDFSSANSGPKNVIDDLQNIVGSGSYYRGPEDPAIFPTQALITFTKFPIINKGYLLLTHKKSGNQCIYVDVKINGTILRIYNVHLESLGFQASDYEEWRNADIVGKLNFLYNANDKFAGAFAERSQQVIKVKQHAAQCPYPYIIAGDFNDTPGSYAINKMGKGLQNAFRKKGTGYAVTYNGGLPDFQIDYVFATNEFDILNYKVIREKLSDHYPVRVNMHLNTK